MKKDVLEEVIKKDFDENSVNISVASRTDPSKMYKI